eukprot:203605-Rhodomonas_salina.1
MLRLRSGCSRRVLAVSGRVDARVREDRRERSACCCRPRAGAGAPLASSAGSGEAAITEEVLRPAARAPARRGRRVLRNSKQRPRSPSREREGGRRRERGSL